MSPASAKMILLLADVKKARRLFAGGTLLQTVALEKVTRAPSA
jgi:hypothetical protein